MLLTQVMSDAMMLQSLTKVRTAALRFLGSQFAGLTTAFGKVDRSRVRYINIIESVLAQVRSYKLHRVVL